jgi:hypothetical protein
MCNQVKNNQSKVKTIFTQNNKNQNGESIVATFNIFSLFMLRYLVNFKNER